MSHFAGTSGQYPGKTYSEPVGVQPTPPPSYDAASAPPPAYDYISPAYTGERGRVPTTETSDLFVSVVADTKS